MTSVVVHEPSTWTVGGREVTGADGGRYLVRVTVPGGHLDDAMPAELVARVTRVLAGHDAAGGRLYTDPRAWVQIIEVPDGHAGVLGRVMPTAAFVDFVVSGSWPGADDARANGASDPICGMAVDLSDSALTLERDGITYGFCSTTGRDLFVARTADAAAPA